MGSTRVARRAGKYPARTPTATNAPTTHASVTASFGESPYNIWPSSRVATSAHGSPIPTPAPTRSEEHTSELQSRLHLVCRLLLEKKKKITIITTHPKLRFITPSSTTAHTSIFYLHTVNPTAESNTHSHIHTYHSLHARK